MSRRLKSLDRKILALAEEHGRITLAEILARHPEEPSRAVVRGLMVLRSDGRLVMTGGGRGQALFFSPPKGLL